MKRATLLFFSFLCSVLLTACSKFQFGNADVFVGTYNVSVVENVVWGGNSSTLNDNGRMVITKLPDNKVKVSGYISTTGEVIGNSVYFEGTYSSDSSGSLTTSFGVGRLSGNVLTFTANQTGQLAYNGRLYPFRSNSSFTAIKQY